MTKGYIASVIESESGWGQKHDGYLICMDKDQGHKFATQVHGNLICGDYSCFSKQSSDWRLVLLTEKTKERIEKAKFNTLWVDSLADYVEEV